MLPRNIRRRRLRPARLPLILGCAIVYPFIAQPARCDAAGGNAEVGDVATLIAKVQELTPKVARLEQRVCFECAVAYLTLRDRPDEARLRFQKIRDLIEAADDRSDGVFRPNEIYDDDIGAEDDDLDIPRERRKLAEWMGRTGLIDDAVRILDSSAAEHYAANGGYYRPHFCNEMARIYAALGCDTEAEAFWNAIDGKDERDRGRNALDLNRERINAATFASFAFHRRGDAKAARKWALLASTNLQAMEAYGGFQTRRVVHALTQAGAESEIVRLMKNIESSGRVRPDETLSLQMDYLRLLIDSGRKDEAAKIVSRLSAEPNDHVNSVEYRATAIAMLGDADAAEKMLREQKTPAGRDYWTASLLKSHSALGFYQMSKEMLRAGRLATGRRYYLEYKRLYKEYEAIREPESDYGKNNSMEHRLAQERRRRFAPASFAVVWGDAGALLRVGAAEPEAGRHHAEFLCRCYLATIFATTLPDRTAPGNEFLDFAYLDEDIGL